MSTFMANPFIGEDRYPHADQNMPIVATTTEIAAMAICAMTGTREEGIRATMGGVDAGIQTRGRDHLLAITTATATAIAAITTATIVVSTRPQRLRRRLAPQNVFHVMRVRYRDQPTSMPFDRSSPDISMSRSRST